MALKFLETSIRADHATAIGLWRRHSAHHRPSWPATRYPERAARVRPEAWRRGATMRPLRRSVRSFDFSGFCVPLQLSEIWRKRHKDGFTLCAAGRRLFCPAVHTSGRNGAGEHHARGSGCIVRGSALVGRTRIGPGGPDNLFGLQRASPQPIEGQSFGPRGIRRRRRAPCRQCRLFAGGAGVRTGTSGDLSSGFRAGPEGARQLTGRPRRRTSAGDAGGGARARAWTPRRRPTVRPAPIAQAG